VLAAEIKVIDGGNRPFFLELRIAKDSRYLRQ
jgi:hypothetical protein